MSVRLSAGRDGESLLASSFARIKAATGVFTHFVFRTFGRTGERMGLNAQCARALIQLIANWFVVALFVRGSGAPIFTHASKSAICSEESFLSFGGIFSSASV